MRKQFWLLLCLILFTSSALFAAHSFGGAFVPSSLDGTWTFYWDKLLTTESSTVQGESVTVPSTWNHPKFGYGTYCKVITGLDPTTSYAFLMNESPGTACAVYVNGKYISSCGTVSTTRVNKACSKPWLVSFMPDSSGKVVIAIQVSNWVYRKAGMWSNVYFGEFAQVKRDFNLRAATSAFVIGMIIFLFIVNMLLFLFNRERWDSLLFALVALMMCARLLTAEFSLLLLVFPNFPYTLARKLEYWIVWGGPPVFMYLLDNLYPAMCLTKGAHKYIPLTSFVVGIVCSCLPLYISCYFVTPMVIIAFVVVIWMSYCSIKHYKVVRTVNKMQLWSLFVILITVVFGLFVNWMMTLTNNSLKFSLIPLFFLLFAVLQFLNMSSMQSKLYYSRMEKSHELQKLNAAYARFVPKEFLYTLHKKDVTEVHLGDNAEANMAIAFFMLNKEANMEEQFCSLASFSERAVSIIEEHNGFLSKFINHGIMALFPHSAADAVKCMLELKKSAEDIGIAEVSCGIHFGKMIVGTIGEENRLDDTVISDTVNTAFRIMEYSTDKTIPIVASAAIVQNVLGTESGVQFTKLGEIPVKGKKEPVLMYSCETAAVQEGGDEK